MSWAIAQREREQFEAMRSTDKPKLSSGYSENFIMGVGQTIDKALSISETFVRESGGWTYEARNKQINDLRKSDQITDEEVLKFTRSVGRSRTKQINYNDLTTYANEKLGLSIQTNEEIDNDMREGLKVRAEMAEEVFSRQSGMGFVGELAGGFTGYSLEPFNTAALIAEPIILGRNAYMLSQASTKLGRALVMAKTSAVVGMTVEAAIQPFLFNWHEEIGVDMSWRDALTNIAAVGVFSGAVGGLSGALSKPVTGITAKEFASLLSTIRKESKKIIDDDVVGDIVKQAENNLNGEKENVTAQDHFENIDAAEEKINNPESKGEVEDEVLTYDMLDPDPEFDVLLAGDNDYYNFKTSDLGEELTLMDYGIDSSMMDDITHTVKRIKAFKDCGG